MTEYLHWCGQPLFCDANGSESTWSCPEHGPVAFFLDGGTLDLDAVRREPSSGVSFIEASDD